MSFSIFDTPLLEQRLRQNIVEVVRGQSGTKAFCGVGMKPDRGASGIEAVHALCGQSADHARQDITGSGRGQPRRAVFVSADAAVRRCDQRLGALQDDRHLGRSRSLLNGHFAALRKQAWEQAFELTFMRRQDIVAIQHGEQFSSPTFEDRQTIRVDHQNGAGRAQRLNVRDRRIV